MYFLRSALSTKARSMDPVMLDVVINKTFGYCFSLSSYKKTNKRVKIIN